ncbi:MAG: hypothetical protein LBJ67_16635 [Planctomycetaceae bacterium]|nr:hypothetical protein [Planctomycetaceae bacterium]
MFDNDFSDILFGFSCYAESRAVFREHLAGTNPNYLSRHYFILPAEKFYFTIRMAFQH